MAERPRRDPHKISFPPAPKCEYCKRRDEQVWYQARCGHYHDACFERVKRSVNFGVLLQEPRRKDRREKPNG